jgi:hypothetical protein
MRIREFENQTGGCTKNGMPSAVRASRLPRNRDYKY